MFSFYQGKFVTLISPAPDLLSEKSNTPHTEL